MNWKRTLVTWLIMFGALLLFSNWFFAKKNPPELSAGPFVATIAKTDYSQDEEVIVKLQNNTDKTIELAISCPGNPLRVLAWDGSQFREKKAETQADCSAVKPLALETGKQQTVSFSLWNHALFSDIGRYKIEVPVKIGKEEKVFATEEFSVKEKGYFRQGWNAVFYQPLYNLLILFISLAPLRDLGMAIIFLTVLIRLILLVPSQRAIESQKKLQEVQPKLDAIKKKYAGNQEKIGLETMELWKKEKVSPFGSCAPMLIQFPVLIALYYVIRNGLNPDNAFLLYAPLQHFDFHAIHSNFLGILELTKVNAFVLPLIVGLLQFGQMKLAVLKKAVKQGDTNEVPKDSEMQQANKMMVYFMPVMIAIFTASVPAGVGVYWAVSTLFGIAQQLVANRGKNATLAVTAS